jgi:ribosome-associated translation inhibitor RaiA
MATLCFTCVGIINNLSDQMTDAVSRVEQAFVDGKTEECVAAAEELQGLWDIFLKYSVLVNDLGHAVEITSSIAEIQAFAQEADSELYAACDRAQAQIKLLRDIQQPTLWKIM